MFIPVSGTVISGPRGVVIQSKGGKMVVKRGYYINLVQLLGNTPAKLGQKGELFRSLLRGGAVSPKTCPKKIEKAGVLGIGCGHLTSVLDLNSEPVGPRGNASRGGVLPLPAC